MPPVGRWPPHSAGPSGDGPAGDDEGKEERWKCLSHDDTTHIHEQTHGSQAVTGLVFVCVIYWHDIELQTNRVDLCHINVITSCKIGLMCNYYAFMSEELWKQLFEDQVIFVLHKSRSKICEI